MNLFIDTHDSLEDLSQDLGLLLGVKGEFVPENDSYRYRLPNCISILRSDHELINDRDMDFASFPYQLEILPNRTLDWSNDKNRCLEWGRTAFERLKSSLRYRLLMTENLQKILSAFDPKSST